jgi:death-on-curing protein
LSPVFLELDEVLEIHQDQIHRYGGSPGVRDMNLLLSAIAMPSSGFGGQYFHKDIFEMAAAYLFHIVQNHPFVDGNKRTGAMTAFTFLHMNGIRLNASEHDFETLVRAVAQNKSDKLTVAEFFRRHSAKKRGRQ